MKKSITLITLILALSCQGALEFDIDTEYSENIEINSDAENFITTEGQTVLGAVIEMPYSVENLQKAYANLSAETKSQIDISRVIPTHYYVRYYPKNEEELDILRNIRPHVFLSEVPLDREIVVGGSYYHDPSIPDSLPTFQYTVVSVERWKELQKAVPVESEVLIEAFIPDYDEPYETKADSYGLPSMAYKDLLKEAYRMTGNEYYEEPVTKAGSWYPMGRITAYDDLKMNYVPVPGVRIRGRHLLTIKECLTDYDGYFMLGGFSNAAGVNVSIVWESDYWDIRNGNIGQATFDGPKISNGEQWWSSIGTDHEKNVRYAAIQRAAYKYFIGSNGGLNRPQPEGKLKIKFLDEVRNYQGETTTSGSNASINICLSKSSTQYYDIYYTFGTAAHELSHVAHFSNNNNLYSQCDHFAKESWAVFAAWILTSIEYSGYLSFSQIQYFNSQTWPVDRNIDYSPIYIDCYDSYNQHTEHGDMDVPQDPVSGYSVSDLNSIAWSSRNYPEIRQNLITYLPTTATTLQLAILLNEYDRYLGFNN